MAFACVLCRRQFENDGALQQHLRNAKVHKVSTPVHSHPQSTSQSSSEMNTHQLPSRPEITNSHKPQPKRPQSTNHSYSTPEHLPYAGTVQMVSRPYPPRPTLPQNRNYYQHNPSTTKHPYGHVSNGTNYYTTPAASAELSNVLPSWSSTFPESEHEANLDALSAQCHSLTDLKENSYITELYDAENYKNQQKCERCNGRESKVSNQPCAFHSFKRNKYNVKKPYKCCTNLDAQGCQTLPNHKFSLSLRAISHQDFLVTPPSSPSEKKLKAVVFDCEMAGIAGGAGEAILLCASDYLTGEVIIHHFVNPTERITQMRDEVHGISKQALNMAVSQGRTLSGWQGARAELWKFIDADTILIGHALQNDLDVLRMIHHRIVDSGIMARKTVGLHRIQWSLPRMCGELLSQKIRESKGNIHECLEDVVATREVVLFCTRQREAFLAWATETRTREMALEAERERVREKKKKEDLRLKEEEAKKVLL